MGKTELRKSDPVGGVTAVERRGRTRARAGPWFLGGDGPSIVDFQVRVTSVRVTSVRVTSVRVTSVRVTLSA